MRWLGSVILGLSAVLLADSLGGRSLAAPAEDKQLRHQEQKLHKIQHQIHQYQQQIQRHRGHEQSVLTRLDALGKHEEGLVQDLRHLTQQLQTTQQRIEELQHQYIRWSEQFHTQSQTLGQRLRQLYKLGRLPSITLLLSAKDVTELRYRVQYTKHIAEYDRKQMQQFREGLSHTAAAQAALATEHQRMVAYQEQLRQKQLALAREQQQKGQLLHQIRQDKQLALRTVEELAQSARQLHALIKKLHASRVQESTAPAVKGQLFWPVQGPLLTRYGRVRHPQLNIDTFQKGIHIGAPLESEVRAVGAGKVVYTDWFKGFGRLLIIDHGKHLVSLYGSTSEILVHVGDYVKPQQIVAKVGVSSSLQEPALYLEIRHHTAPQDPLLWLRHRSASPAD